MIKKHTEVVSKETEVIDDIICNKCGKPIKKHCECNILHDHLHISKDWGFFSNHDTEIHNIDICEDCCEEIAKSFKIPPDIKNYM